MRFILLFVLVLAGCARTITPYTYTLRSENVKFQIIDISDILKEKGVEGTVLIYDEKNNQYYSNDYALAKDKYCPASTFKIANTLVGLETGTIPVDHTFKWDGKERDVVNWNQDLSLRDAFQFSCVPCYQDLARQIGVKKMRTALDSMGYPGMNVRADNVDQFWLTKDSKISPLEQVDFLKRLNTRSFSLKPETLEAFKKIAIVEDGENGKLYAKTGLSMMDGKRIDGGWYVGWIQKEKNRIYFATHITPTKEVSNADFMGARIDVTFSTLDYLNYW